MKIRRIWPTTGHPRPRQLRPGDTVIIAHERHVTVQGMGRAHDLAVASCIDDHDESVLIGWHDQTSQWTVLPWSAVTSEMRP